MRRIGGFNDVDGDALDLLGEQRAGRQIGGSLLLDHVDADGQLIGHPALAPFEAKIDGRDAVALEPLFADRFQD